MSSSEMPKPIRDLLAGGVRDAIETNSSERLKAASLEAYRLRVEDRGIKDDRAALQHVFPADVEQTVQLGLRLQPSDPEKASVVIKGAVEQILKRLSIS